MPIGDLWMQPAVHTQASGVPPIPACLDANDNDWLDSRLEG
ncbi:hypothetical protein [Aureliella helgolandensis]|uniref:Uncharacterized protein n=1 Tax=Aureliella helgolandensis TaxID=2527968 RepID=A0A518G3U8_9BACT|nr:hypothetical protein [Aureliella helgolandensis]QDV23276.1 hypothetical protein Q31a_15740 [Aureliella helgolandensis]